MIEYTYLRGENDGPEDYQALCAFTEGLEVHINIIPCNSKNSGVPLEEDVIAAKTFGERLKSDGYTVTLRRSLGADISAACGQLATREGAGKNT